MRDVCRERSSPSRPRAVARTITVPRGVSAAPEPITSKTSRPVRPSELATDSPAMNSSGSTPMFTRLLRWIRSKLSAMTAFTPSSIVPFAAQSRDEPEPYSLPARMISGTPCFLIQHRGVVDAS